MKIEALAGAVPGGDFSGLCTLLRECVQGGASIGFVLPLAAAEVSGYWEGILGRRLRRGAGSSSSRGTRPAGGILGSAQVAFVSKANGRHRAEIQKVMVLPSERRKGIAAALMAEAESAALLARGAPPLSGYQRGPRRREGLLRGPRLRLCRGYPRLCPRPRRHAGQERHLLQGSPMNDERQEDWFGKFAPSPGVHRAPPSTGDGPRDAVVFRRSATARNYRLSLGRDGVAVATIPARGTQRRGRALRRAEPRVARARARAPAPAGRGPPTSGRSGTRVLWRGAFEEIRVAAAGERPSVCLGADVFRVPAARGRPAAGPSTPGSCGSRRSSCPRGPGSSPRRRG